MPRLGVLGTFVWDRIWHPAFSGGEPREQWGGLAYSLAAFGAACPDGWEIVPIARIGADRAPSLFDFVDSLPHISSRAGLQVVAEANNRVDLRYVDRTERTEQLSGGVGGWSIDELLPIAGELDALYINFISGFELDLATTTRLRAAIRSPMYADLHSLFLGAPGDGPRPPRRLHAWKEWLGLFDFVQLNDRELDLLGPPDGNSDEKLRGIPELGPSIVLVTRGGRGATVARRADLGSRADLPGSRARSRTPGAFPAVDVEVIDYPAPAELTGGDPTGCGDVWGSVAFAGILQGLPLPAAVLRAHGAAAAKIRSDGIDRLALDVAAMLGRSESI